MTDREKVIKGLKCCLNESHADCAACYQQGPGFGFACREGLMRNALELLEAQEPRVLTLEEVKNDCPDYVYLEIASGWIECCIKDEGDSNKSVGYFIYGFGEYSIKEWKKYGKTWRCWTVMPTDELRRMVKWDV